MKKKLIGFLVIFVTALLIPAVIVKNTALTDALDILSNIGKDNDELLLTELCAAEFNKNYCNETLKALIIILNSNYNCNKKAFSDKHKRLNKKAFAKKYSNGYNYYSKIENYVKEFKNYRVEYKGKAAALPYFTLSNGSVHGNKKYPYIKNAACPWDKLKKGCSSSAESVGISLNTLNTLCKSGRNYREALSYFLTDEIEFADT